MVSCDTWWRAPELFGLGKFIKCSEIQDIVTCCLEIQSPNWQHKLHLLTPVFQECLHRVNFLESLYFKYKKSLLETDTDQEMTADEVPWLWM